MSLNLRSQAKTESKEKNTTEKYGLEAGLWKVFTSKEEEGEDGEQKLGRGALAKQLLAQYGSAYLITSISFAIVSFAACYALVNSGASFTLLSMYCSTLARELFIHA